MATKARGAPKGEIDLGQAEAAFTETITRVVDGREQVTLTRDGEAVAAIVPIEDLRLLREMQRQRIEELAQAGRLWRQRMEERGAVPGEKLPPDPAWGEHLAEVIARIRSRIPAEVTPEEIEADIAEAIAEVRRERRACRC